MEDWPVVVELLSSLDDNVKKVESLAQREIFSIEVPVFNGLRDILPFSILTALRRMEFWFGKTPTIEHAFCLVVLTDYVSCTFNQRNFYRTFENALTAKFVDSLFEKLYEEWRKVFSGRPLIRFTDPEMEGIRKSLSRSVDRFPESFRHKFLLNHIVQLSGRYCKVLSEKRLEEDGIKLPPIQRPLVSSENLLWKEKYKDESKNWPISGQKKSKADMNKYVVKKPIHKELSVPVGKQSTENIPVKSAKNTPGAIPEVPKVTSAASQADKELVELLKKDDYAAYEDDSMDSVDIYLTRRSIYSPTASSYGSEPKTVPRFLSPINSFFEELEGLNECPSEVSDSDEDRMKMKSDSNFSAISAEDRSKMKWSDEEKLKVNRDSAKNSEYSSLTLSDEEKMDLNSDFFSKTVMDAEKKLDLAVPDRVKTVSSLPKTVTDAEKKLVNGVPHRIKTVSCLPKMVTAEKKLVNGVPDGVKKNVTCDLPRIVTDEEKMNVVNNNSSAVSDKEVISVCDCCPTKPNHTSGIPVPITAPKRKLNAFDILMRKVVPPKRKRFSK